MTDNLSSDTPNVSPEAAALVAAGAHPTDVDADSLLAQIQSLQARLTELEAERGVPSDPVGGALANVTNHINAHIAANPSIDFSQLQKTLNEFPEDHKDLEDHHVQLLKLEAESHHLRNPHLDFHYVRQLTADLYREVLRRQSGGDSDIRGR